MPGFSKGMRTSQSNTQTAQLDKSQVQNLLIEKEEFFINFYGKHGYKRAMETSIAIATDPKFDKCSPLSIVEAILASARVGLDIELGEAWLVPYKETVQFQIGSKGFSKLLYNSTAGWLVDAEPIYEGDAFDYEITDNGKNISFKPDLFNRKVDDQKWVYKNLKAIYVSASDREGRKVHRIITRAQIEKLRLNSPGQKFASQWTKPYVRERIAKCLPVDIWEKWYEEMAITKAIKLFAKRLPLGDRNIEKAIKLDDLSEVGKEAEFVSESSSILIEQKPEMKRELSAMDKLFIDAQKYGFKLSGPTEGAVGKFWIKATIEIDGATAEDIIKIGFKAKGDFFVMNVTHLM